MNDNHKPDHGNHNDHDNDNGARSVAPAPAGTALASLAAQAPRSTASTRPPSAAVPVCR
jgi:hypothetical protein